jgi:hypothetical protein
MNTQIDKKVIGNTEIKICATGKTTFWVSVVKNNKTVSQRRYTKECYAKSAFSEAVCQSQE